MFRDYFYSKRINPAPLSVFRIFFGLFMLVALIRFWINGWIYSLYIAPKFHFKYYGFSWVKDLGQFTYVLYFFAIIACLGIILGYRYRLSIVSFFLIFTYTELIDKTTYLNHYYFVSCVSFLLCFLPAGRYFSLDVIRKGKKIESIPAWMVDSLKLFITIVYLYAGIAKINSDWLFESQPLSLWLSSKYHIFIIGDLLQQKWVHYTASWAGMIYDVCIGFLLWNPKTRLIAFLLVLIFHIMTKVFFPSIGMFPFIMILSATIFFNTIWHQGVITRLKNYFYRGIEIVGIRQEKIKSNFEIVPFSAKKYILPLFLGFFLLQVFIPFRHIAYPGELFWNEEGYRFSWRVMLIEKKGYTTFKIKDSVSQKTFYVNNSDFLTPFQERQMSFQPDFILEYAHYLATHFSRQGHQNVQVFADSYVALNGRPSQRFINPKIDLIGEIESFKHKTWIIPLADEIKGL